MVSLRSCFSLFLPLSLFLRTFSSSTIRAKIGFESFHPEKEEKECCYCAYSGGRFLSKGISNLLIAHMFKLIYIGVRFYLWSAQ